MLHKNKDKPKILAIIPARGGSKGIPGKNIKVLAGKPLIYYSIQAALSSSLIDDVYVSTENPAIKEVALRYGAKVIDRPVKLSTDEAISEDAIIHGLQHLGNNLSINYDICVFIQATSPLTTPDDLDKLIMVVMGDKDSAAFYVKDYGHFFGIDDMMRVRLPRQIREARKRETGNAWAFKTEGFLKTKSRLFGDIGLVEIEEPRHLEIDTPYDFSVVEFIMKNKLGVNKTE